MTLYEQISYVSSEGDVGPVIDRISELPPESRVPYNRALLRRRMDLLRQEASDLGMSVTVMEGRSITSSQIQPEVYRDGTGLIHRILQLFWLGQNWCHHLDNQQIVESRNAVRHRVIEMVNEALDSDIPLEDFIRFVNRESMILAKFSFEEEKLPAFQKLFNRALSRWVKESFPWVRVGP